MPFREITAFCADTLHHKMAAQACRYMAAAGFKEIVLATDEEFLRKVKLSSLPRNLRIELIPPLASKADYSYYTFNHMVDHIRTKYALVFQWDGFVINRDLWWPGYLEYDYVGAPWPDPLTFGSGRHVGNGGFSLRSRKLMLAARTIGGDAQERAEDLIICQDLAKELEENWQIKFASTEVAKYFSAECLDSLNYSERTGKPAEKTFGFHGFFNFHLAFNDVELFSMIDDLNTEQERINLFTLPETTGLMLNLERSGRIEAAKYLAQRMAHARTLTE